MSTGAADEPPRFPPGLFVRAMITATVTVVVNGVTPLGIGKIVTRILSDPSRPWQALNPLWHRDAADHEPSQLSLFFKTQVLDRGTSPTSITP